MKQMSKRIRSYHQPHALIASFPDALQEGSIPERPEHLHGQNAMPGRVQLPGSLQDRPPAEYAASWRHAGQSFARDLRALNLLATTGWSSRLSLNQWLVQHDPKLGSTKAGSIGRLWVSMEDRGLVEQRTVQVSHRPKIQVALVWLSDEGYRFLREMGLPALVISEWDRLRLVHNSPEQPVHTAMVALAAHFMRQRGYHTLVCPTGLGSPYRPDLAIFEPQTGHRCYVEVEAPHSGGRAHAERLERKWRQLAAHQDFVAICALNPEQRQRKVASARQVFAHGLATDLITLHAEPEIAWPQAWGHLRGAGGPGSVRPYICGRPQM